MRSRLIISFALVILVTLVSVLFFAQQTRQEVRAYSFMLRGGMASSPELVSELESYYAANGGWDGVVELFQSPGMHRGMGQGMGPGMMGTGNGPRVRLADEQGVFVYDSSDETPQGRITQSQKLVALSLEGPDGQIAGYFLVEGDETALLNRLSVAARNAALVAAGVALFLALLLATSLVHPIRELTHAAGRMARGDLSQRVRVKGNDEIANLGNAFNNMATSLEEAEQSRRSMTADIAHELRTPLAIQRAQLEALQDGIYPLTLENLLPLVDQNAQLNRLVDDLRTLALAEAGELQLECQATDFPQLVNRILERFEPQAGAKRIRLIFEPDPERECPILDLDAGRIEQTVNNLLTNALRHTPEDGTIRLTMQCGPQRVELAVNDSGPGIPAEAMPFLFERFYRADRARARTDGGTGLGLAIARQLARAHRGDLTAQNAPEGGAEFKLSLPVGWFDGKEKAH